LTWRTPAIVSAPASPILLSWGGIKLNNNNFKKIHYSNEWR
jgi:hypothetical protein